MMIDLDSYRQNAADCVRQAESEAAPEDKNLLLNVALAWVRLAHQVQQVGIPAHLDQATEADTKAAEADDKPSIQPEQSEPAEIDNLGKPLVTH